MAQHTAAFISNYIQPKVHSHILGVAFRTTGNQKRLLLAPSHRSLKVWWHGRTQEPVKKCGVNDLQDYRKSVCRESRLEGFKARVLRWGWTLAPSRINQGNLDEILTSLISVTSSVKWTAGRNK